MLTLGPFGFVASAFDRQAPLTERRIVVGFELLDGELHGFQRRRCQHVLGGHPNPAINRHRKSSH
jgi:hypothetical protein